MIYSISILVHNRPEMTKRCLESVIESVAPDYEEGEVEIIVTDNASDQETIQVIEEAMDQLPRGVIQVIRQPRNRGVIEPKNEALNFSSGDYFVSLDNDCIVSRGWLERLREPFDRDPKIAQTGRKGGFRTLTRDGIGVRGAGIDYVDGSCFMVQADLARKLGLCDTVYEFAYCEDSDFSLRLRKAGWRIELVGAGVQHREHATASRMNLSRVWEKNHRTFVNRWRGYLRTRSFGHPGEPR